jgi:hypothetical protein
LPISIEIVKYGLFISLDDVWKYVAILTCVVLLVLFFELVNDRGLSIQVHLLENHGWVDTLVQRVKQKENSVRFHILLGSNLHLDGLLPDVLQPSHGLLLLEICGLVPQINAVGPLVVDAFTGLQITGIIQLKGIGFDGEWLTIGQFKDHGHADGRI